MNHKKAFFLLLLLLPTQLGKHFWIASSFVLGRRIDYLSPTLFATDILVVITLFFWWRQEKIKISRHLFYFFLIFFSLCIVNIGVAHDSLLALFKAFKLAELSLLGLYIVVTKPKLSYVALPLVISSIYSGGLAYVQFALQHSLGGLLWFAGERTFYSGSFGIAAASLGGRLVLRPYATFPHPNVLAGFTLVLLPLLTYFFFTQKSYKKLLIAGIFFSLTSLLLSMSRVAWVIGFGTMILVSTLFFTKGLLATVIQRKETRAYLCAVVGIAIVGILIIGPRLQGLVEDPTSVRERVALTRAAVELFKTSPFFGIGFNNFIPLLPSLSGFDRELLPLQPVHSLYVLILVEAGVVGLGLLLWFLIRTFIHALLYRKLWLTVSFGMLLLLGLFDHYFVTLQQGQLLATIIIAFVWIEDTS